MARGRRLKKSGGDDLEVHQQNVVSSYQMITLENVVSLYQAIAEQIIGSLDQAIVEQIIASSNQPIGEQNVPPSELRPKGKMLLHKK